MIGEKDSNGNPTDVQSFEVVGSDGNTTYTQLNENKTISSARHSSGMTMDFKWKENDTKVTLIIFDPETSQQVVISIDLMQNITNTTELDEFDEQAEEVLSKRDITESNSYKKRKKTIRYKTDDTSFVQETRIKRNTQPQNTARISVSVELCGSPVDDAVVQADVTQDDTTNQYDGQLSTTPGLYYIYIPTKTSIAEVTGDICDAVEMALDTACGWYDNINKAVEFFTGLFGKKRSLDQILCFYVGKGLQLIPQLRLVPIYRFCKLIFKGIDYYCNVINKPIIPGGPKKSELICDGITKVVDVAIDPLFNSDIHFVPSAIISSNGKTVTGEGQQLTLEPGTSQVSTTFTLSPDSILQIIDLTITPPDPAPREDYIAVVQYQCYSNTTHVTMHIVGTDDYTNSITCIGGPSCTLAVPGAEALVRDTVTVTINDQSSGQSAYRVASIIF